MLLNNRCYDKTTMDNGMKMDDNMMSMPMCNEPMTCAPIYECPQERVCHRQTIIEVPHIIPVNTRIVNHQIYHHTYTPCFTACEETEVCNVYDNKCGM